jgi:hypothetical protein
LFTTEALDAANSRRLVRPEASSRHPPAPVPGHLRLGWRAAHVEISKDRQQFQIRKFIETGMTDVHGRLVRSRFLKGLTVAAFAEQAAVIPGDINYIHPFREGNGRTQLQYLKQIAGRPGTPSTSRGSRVRIGSPPR